MLTFICELCDTTIEDPETDDFYYTLPEPIQVSTGVNRVCKSCEVVLRGIGDDSMKMSEVEHIEAHQESYIMARLALKAVEEAVEGPTIEEYTPREPSLVADEVGEGAEWLAEELKAGAPQKSLGDTLRDAAEYSTEGLIK